MRRLSLPPSPVHALVNTAPIECTQFYYSFDENDSGDDKQHHLPLLRSTSDLSRHLAQDGLARYRIGSFSSSTSTSFVARLTDIEQHYSKTHDVELTQRSAHTWTCLDKILAENLQSFLPPRVALSTRWCLLYSLDQHGCSLYTLYDCMENYNGPCLLVIQTTDEEIFGAYISESLHVSSRYYGSGECFLWRTTLHQLQIYPWTAQNTYLVYSDLESITVGGGDGRIGFWLHRDLLHGHSDVCATFDNPQLSQQPNFECLGIEIWGFCF